MEQTSTVSSGPSTAYTISRSPWLWLIGVAALSILLLVAFALRMLPPREGSPEATFARDMIAHHAQAVEMALILRDRTDDEELRHFALDILLTQQAQIGQMQGWLTVWGLPLAGLEPPMGGQGVMMGMATLEQLNALRTLPPEEAEVAFLQLMTRHHEFGVVMAEEVLDQTDEPVVENLARGIVQAQQSEIDYMEELLARRGAEPLPPPEPMEMEHSLHGG